MRREGRREAVGLYPCIATILEQVRSRYILLLSVWSITLLGEYRRLPRKVSRSGIESLCYKKYMYVATSGLIIEIDRESKK